MYLTYNKNYWAIDIEADDLDATVVWCLCAVNIVTGEEVELTTEDSIRNWINARKRERAKFIGHNIIGFDAATLNRLLRCGLTISDLVDTFLLSMLYSPSLAGGHSLEAWGVRLKFPKSKFNDFSKLTPEMVTYCLRDARLCARIFLALVKRMVAVGFSEEGCEIEHRAWSIIQRQRRNGFAFNMEEALVLYTSLRERQNGIQERINEFWPPKLECVKTFKRPFKANGEPSANYARHQREYVDVRVREDANEYDCYDYVYFSVGSPLQRTEKLLQLGWEPKEFTPTGNPKPTDKGRLVPSLVKFVEESGKEEVRLIAQWMEYYNRANMINTWMEAYNGKTGCIHGSLWLANTLRYRHSNPNTANIPAVRLGKDEEILKGEAGVFTYEARNLWTVRSIDRRLVGVDAKGIQLRVLAHYLNNKKFTEAVLEGDPHSYNQEIGGFGSRAIAKTFIYAFLLGAGDEKVGQIIGGSTKDGREIKSRFINNFPGLSNLLDDLAGQVERTGRIRLCDRTPIIVTAPHTRLGYLLQGDESRIMKKASIITDREVIRRHLDVLKVGDIHDEWQNDTHKDNVNEFTEEVCPYAFRSSGEFFNYRIPIDCDAKVGMTWAETH